MRSFGQTALAAALAVALVGGVASSAGATTTATPNRLAGVDRFHTARVIAEQTFPSGSSVAMLASGRDFPDSLAAAFLSGMAQRPVLLTEPTVLSPGVTDTLDAMGIEGVQVLGGASAVSDVVLQQLRDLGYTVERLTAGEDRYHTARLIAEFLPPEVIGDFGAGRAAFIVTGTDYPDALAAGPLSASQGIPILLTEGGSLNEHARAALTSRGIEQALIVGGIGAVSQTVEDQIDAMGIAVRRISGPHRQGTALALARVAEGELSYPTERVLLARGDGFADALAGGPRGGRLFAPILLIESATALGPSATEFIRDFRDRIQVVEALGGTSAVPDPILDAALAVAREP